MWGWLVEGQLEFPGQEVMRMREVFISTTALDPRSAWNKEVTAQGNVQRLMNSVLYLGPPVRCLPPPAN